jgi:hypothetical protein
MSDAARLALLLRFMLAARVLKDSDARVTRAAVAIRKRLDGTVQGDIDHDEPTLILRDDAVVALLAADSC